MDLATTIGIALGLLSLIGGFLLEGGEVSALLQIGAAIIVFGGTFGAVIASFGIEQIKSVIPLVKIAFVQKKQNHIETIRVMTKMATVSRREGLLALEEYIDQLKDNLFLQKGLQLVIDSAEPEMIRDILQLEIANIEERHKLGAKVFEAAGGFAPTMGIIGTVMGLVHVLSNLSQPDTLGHSIALAFIATLYGVMSANVVYLPIANKLKLRSRDEIIIREMETEGLLSIQSGENPNIVKEKLMAFLPNQARQEFLLEEQNGGQGGSNEKKAS
ncbi:flagellar motor protein [Ammoniphilus resinae]|uniref:Chemotaxis protein MotA n=1 Tax=Ammoniphilus resinae TaxID=861532 RepID=A0ABS4GNK0_9BACL|nr:chemotaxis protein MotA [Ammoniphilus resinae]